MDFDQIIHEFEEQSDVDFAQNMKNFGSCTLKAMGLDYLKSEIMKAQRTIEATLKNSSIGQ